MALRCQSADDMVDWCVVIGNTTALFTKHASHHTPHSEGGEMGQVRRARSRRRGSRFAGMNHMDPHHVTNDSFNDATSRHAPSFQHSR